MYLCVSRPWLGFACFVFGDEQYFGAAGVFEDEGADDGGCGCGPCAARVWWWAPSPDGSGPGAAPWRDPTCVPGSIKECLGLVSLLDPDSLQTRLEIVAYALLARDWVMWIDG